MQMNGKEMEGITSRFESTRRARARGLGDALRRVAGWQKRKTSLSFQSFNWKFYSKRQVFSSRTETFRRRERRRRWFTPRVRFSKKKTKTSRERLKLPIFSKKWDTSRGLLKKRKKKSKLHTAVMLPLTRYSCFRTFTKPMDFTSVAGKQNKARKK